MNLRHNSKSGFTLIELLVVMLILVILTVTALPAIREYMIRARYTADVDPAIGNIRTKVELYRYEHDHLPGMALAKGTSNLQKDGENGNDYSDFVIESFIQEGDDQPTYIHSMSYSENDPAESGKPAYMSVEWEGVPNDNEGKVVWDDNFVEAKDTDETTKGLAWHAFKQLDISYNDLRARFVAPYNFQYAVLFNRGEDFCWVVGAMGTGGGLPMGTGYAVLEYNNTSLGTKFIATFERYRAESSAKPLTLWGDKFEGSGTHGVSDETTAAENAKQYVIIEGSRETFPTKDEIKDGLSADTKAAYATALETFKDNLIKAGWKVE